MEFNIKLLFVITSMVLNFNAAAKKKYHCLHPMMNGISIFFTLILPEVTYGVIRYRWHLLSVQNSGEY